jgi:molybdate transport system substrate-binding protein
MKRRSRVLLAFAAAVLVVVGVGASPASAATQPKLNVFAAASLYKAFPAMVKPFKAKYPQYGNVKFVFNFQGTDALVAQIELGAPADVFAGASTKYGTQLRNDGFVNAPRLFCQNKLCVITPSSNPAHIATLGDLTKSGTLIAMGDAAVPIGTYTRTVLTNITNSGIYGPDYSDQVMANVAATVANVNMLTALVKLGEVDAGFVYRSDRLAAGTSVTTIGIANAYQSNPLPTYPVATVKTAARPALAQRFVQFVMSSAGQKILKRWGFLSKPYPVISAVSPASGAAGSPVSITGTNFFPGQVKIGGVVATTTAWSATSITATVPDSLAAGDTKIVVRSDGRSSKAFTFTVTP